MKQKYVVQLDNETGKLAIQEYAELDKEMLSLLCEETYDAQAIKAAMERDRSDLIQALRTHNMYPPGIYTERIADAIVEMFHPGANTSTELFFEERDMFQSMNEEETVNTSQKSDGEDADEEVDDLLDDDFEGKGIVKNLKKTVQQPDEDNHDDDA